MEMATSVLQLVHLFWGWFDFIVAAFLVFNWETVFDS